MVELYLLEQLNKFATCGTLSDAAEELHMTQPTLTRSMKKLEDYFGFPLFIRKKKRILLNDTGKLLAEYAKKILDEEADMELQVRKFHQNQNTIRIGSITSGPLFYFLPSATTIFPNETIASTVDTEEALLHGLMADEYTFIFLTHPLNMPGYTSQIYAKEHLHAYVSQNHPLASKKSITLKEMNGEDFFIFAESTIWANIVHTHMPDSSIYKQESIEAMNKIIKQTELSTFSTNLSQKYLSGISSDRISIPFSDQEANITYYTVCKEKHASIIHGITDNA